MRLVSRSTLRRPGLFALSLAAIAVMLPVSEADAQRRIEGRRYGGGPLYRNAAGRALGSGTVRTPDGLLGNNVLGTGDALDGSLQIGSGGRNFFRPSGYSYAAVQARNLVVTNGVAGGRGFREDVGYRAPGDFAGETGGADTYDFRRDSALSGLEFVSSSQQRDPFNIAQGVGVFQYRRDFTALPQVNSVAAASRIDDAEIRLDRAATTLRTGNLLDTAVAPADIGYVQVASEADLRRVTASPTRGVQFEMMSPDGVVGTYEQALLNDITLQSLDPASLGYTTEPFDPRLEIPGPPDAEPSDQLITSPASGASAYGQIIQRIYENYEGRDDVTLDTAGLERMRQDLGRLNARIDGPRIGTVEDERPETLSERREGLPGDRRPGRGQGDGSEGDPLAGDALEDPFVDPLEAILNPGTDDSDPSGSETQGGQDASESADPSAVEEETGPRSLDELIDVLAHRSQIGELIDPRMRDRVAEVVAQAEEAMRNREYFRAEDRFDLALRLRPGHPVLEAGRANAQIGAGLYRSAAVTLVGLFRKHEAMIDVSYGEGLLPSRTRLRLAIQTIEKLIEEDPEGSSGLGIVAAYIGRQFGDREMIERGLDSIDDPRVTSLVPKLREIWLSPKPLTGIGEGS